MNIILYNLCTLSQFHQVVLISIISSIIVSIIRLKIKGKEDYVYQFMVVGVYVILELAVDITLASKFVVLINPVFILQEILTIIAGVALSYTIYDAWHKLIKKIKELKK